MKRFCLWLTALVMLLSLCGCREKGNPNIYDVIYGEQTYTVDQEQCTVACDGVVYPFEVTGRGGGSVRLTITYPDGSSYWWQQDSSFGSGGWSGDYDPEGKGYVPGDILKTVLGLDRSGSGSSEPSLILVPLLLIVGAFLVITPQAAWMLGGAWKYKNAEPSGAALGFNRLLGGILMFAGLIGLLASRL